jgi:hydrogenase nickel incorporation protein HypB
MCATCGCSDHLTVEVHESLLKGNDDRAAHLRHHFAEDGVTALNLMGSPGSGKTALLEATAHALQGRYQMAAVSGDLATDRDGARLRAAGLPALTITTGQACHLDAKMIHDALHHGGFGDLDYFFIENVGNLVCPAIFDLGQRANVVLLSVTEGEDKPIKYPVMFERADLVLLTKIDLLPHLDVDLHAIRAALGKKRVLELSARSGEGIRQWIDWLEELRTASASPRPIQ